MFQLRTGIHFLIIFSLPTCSLCSAQTGVWTDNVERLIASDGSGGAGGFEDPGDYFGISVSIAGDTAIVGAQNHDALAPDSSGAVYVFSRIGTQWVEGAKLVASDAAAEDYFGNSCDISGDTIVVGAIGNGSGAIYVFARQGTHWVEQARRFRQGHFGQQVAIHGDTLVASASGAGIGGTAYVFVRNGVTWSEQAMLAPEDLARSAGFGHSVAIMGDLAVVGAQWDDPGGLNAAGSAYVFGRDGTNWSQLAKLTADDGEPGDNFGTAVAIGRDVIAVGSASADGDTFISSGAVYVFRRDSTAWSQEAKLVQSDPAGGANLGISTSLCGDMLVAGAPGSLATYVFLYDGVRWQEVAKPTAFDDPSPWGDLFGITVCADGNNVLVGAPQDEPLGNESGAAYLYSVARRAGTATCFGTTCPCGNTDPSAGCANSTGVGGFLVGTGSRSVSCESSLEFTATQLPQPTSALLYMGDTAAAAPLLDGIQCAGGTTYRLTGLMQTADGAGAITFGPGVLGASSDLIDPGETWHFQAFYRDAVGSPCGAGANLTNAYSVTFLP